MCIDTLLDIPRLDRTGEYVTVQVVENDSNTYRRVRPGFYKRYEIDVPKIFIHYRTIVTLIDETEQTSSISSGKTNVMPYDLPEKWLFMSIQDSHERNIGTIETIQTAPLIRFYTWNAFYNLDATFTTNILENVIAIEIINAELLVTNELREEYTFYSTVHFLGAYMDNRNIRLDKSYWGPINTMGTNSYTRNSFSIIEIPKEIQGSNGQQILYLKSPDFVYVNVGTPVVAFVVTVKSVFNTKEEIVYDGVFFTAIYPVF